MCLNFHKVTIFGWFIKTKQRSKKQDWMLRRPNIIVIKIIKNLKNTWAWNWIGRITNGTRKNEEYVITIAFDWTNLQWV